MTHTTHVVTSDDVEHTPRRRTTKAPGAEWPALMDQRVAAAYTGTTPRFLRDLRHRDMERQRLGEPIDGPPWVRLSTTTVRYRKTDLDRWIAELPTLERGEEAA